MSRSRCGLSGPNLDSLACHSDWSHLIMLRASCFPPAFELFKTDEGAFLYDALRVTGKGERERKWVTGDKFIPQDNSAPSRAHPSPTVMKWRHK